LDVDPNYIKGLATINLMQYTWVIYNLDWTVLQNDSTEPCVTSDNPVSLSYSRSPRDPVCRILPITPRLAVSVRFDPRSDPAGDRLSTEDLAAGLARPPAGTITYSPCNVDQALGFNVIQARSAEDLVFSSVKSERTCELVRDAASFRMDVRLVQFPDPDGDPDAMIVGTVLTVQEH
jgi:hypothetical protein